MAINEKLVEILAWPTVAVLLGFTALVMFRAQVRQFLNRAQSVGKGWLVAAPPEKQSLGSGPSDAVAEFLDAFSGELMRAQEKVIRDDLAARKLDGHPELEKVLVRSLAAVQIALEFEQIHGTIWDGQIQLMETLNTSPDGIDRSFIERVYRDEFQGKRAFYKSIDFDTYIAWPVQKSLILIDGDKLAITVLGREFLKWRVENGKHRRGAG
jgi:hypothetical protein